MGRLTKLFAVAVFAVAVIGVGQKVNAASANVYVAQSPAGSANGSSCANAYAYTFFNSSANWGSGASQIGPGTVVHICGTISVGANTEAFVFQGSGTSGSPVTLYFEPGAVLTSPEWPANGAGGAIDLGGNSYITIDGNGGTLRGVIQATANGDAGAACLSGSCTYHGDSNAIEAASGASNVTIKGLTIADMYVTAKGVPNGGGGTCTYIYGQFSNWTVANNIMHDMSWCVEFQYSSGSSSNITVSNNEIYNADHGIVFGGYPAGANLSNVNVYGNSVHDYSNWDTGTADVWHHDGIHVWGYNNNGSDIVNGVNIYDNRFGGCMGQNMTAHVFIENNAGGTKNVKVYNNTFTDTCTVGPVYGGYLETGSDSGVQAYNNTFVGQAQDTCVGITGSNTTFVNNIVSGCGTLVYAPAGTTYVSGGIHNNVYANCPGSNCFDYHGNFSQAFSTWQQGSGDANSIYVSSANLSSSLVPQSGSTAIGAGANLSSLGIGTLTADIAGVVRASSGAWDAGAYAVSSGSTGGSSGSSGGTVTPPSPTSYTLTIAKSGTGTGTVNGAGVNCGATCSATIAAGTSVTLSASPASGSTFGGWSGPCSGTGTCTLAVSANTTVTASFALATASADTTPPSVPAGLSATAASTAQINLSWNASTDNVGVTGYRIYRNGTQIATTAGTAYSSTGLSASTVYSYTVSAYDAAGNASAQSSAVSATTQSAPTPTPTSTPVTTPAAGCATVGAAWQNMPFTAQSNNTFTVQFDATPAGSGIDSVFGISSAAAAQFTDLAAIVRFNASGMIDTMNSSAYQAQSVIPYTGGVKYHFVITVNASAKTYSATVAAPASAPIAVASNYQFRNTQAAATSFSYLGGYSDAGSAQVCNLSVAAVTVAPTPTSTPAPQTSPLTITTASLPTGTVGMSYSVQLGATGGTAPYTWANLGCTGACNTGMYWYNTGLLSGIPGNAGVSTFSFEAIDSAGATVTKQLTLTVGAPATISTVLPAAPGGVGARDASVIAVALSWSAPNPGTYPIAGYKIFRNGSQIGTTAQPSYTDSGLSAGTVYTYTVAAYDSNGNAGTQSAAITVTAQSAGVTVSGNAVSTSPVPASGATTITVGGNVATIASLNVRTTPSPFASRVGTEASGATGSVVSGPVIAFGYTWWNIKWANGSTGWSVANYLKPVPTAVAAAPLDSPAIAVAPEENGAPAGASQLANISQTVNVQALLDALKLIVAKMMGQQ